MPNLLYGIHDREGRHILPPGGWCVDTIALSENPTPTDYRNLRGDINWIVRANWGYGTTGTIPLSHEFERMRVALAAYVHNSRGARHWIIGNEPNHEQERPNGVYITPADYARCFAMCRDTVKRVDSSAIVIPAPCAPYHANPVPWMDYLRELLGIIAANGGCDGVAIHAYARSSDPYDINENDIRMGPGPLEGQFAGFLTYIDALEAVPARLRHLPAYITEFNELLPDGWEDRNTGVVQAAYASIHGWNQEADRQKFQCLVLYRWPRYDKWHIDGKQGVIDDFRAAVAEGYQSAEVHTHTPIQQVHLPSIFTGGDNPPPKPSLPPRDIDPRLTQRGVTIDEELPAPGMTYWRLVRARWFDEQESQGRHHIYVEALDEQGKPIAGLAFQVEWPGGGISAPNTKSGLGFEAGNFPMSPSRSEFSVKMANGASDRVRGIGMGSDTSGGYNAGIHTSTLLTFQLTTAPQVQPATTHLPTVGTGPQPAPTPVQTQPMATGIIEPRVAQAILKIESGGRTHGVNGLPLIRFEAHIFVGKAGDTGHFRFNAAKPWTDQQVRVDPNAAWRNIHTGNQADEYAALNVATVINRQAAYESISMGAGQIMGFNHARIGFPSAVAMFDAFHDPLVQTIGFINFFLSDPQLTAAMHRKDWREIARKYNGSGQVDLYAGLLEKAYRELGGT